MADAAALALALPALLLALGAAVVRAQRFPEAAVAVGGAVLLVASGAIGWSGVSLALSRLGPTVGFLAALLVLAEGCRREGVFDAIGSVMARAAGARPQRLLALVFVFASLVTAVLSLDATVVLLTPVVMATLAGTTWRREPPLLACTHLANSASLLLPVSNLTNLLAFHDSGLSFTRFSAVMALPWLAAIAAEWVAFRVFFRRNLELAAPTTAPDSESLLRGMPGEPSQGGPAPVPLPRRAMAIVGLTLLAFMLSSPLGIAPAWIAAAGAAAMMAQPLRRGELRPAEVLRAADPPFLIFVLALGVTVQAASDHGLASAAHALLPAGTSLPDLLLIAVVAAAAANLLNNLPATLLLAPVAAASGAPAVLAVLVGVNVGPNLTPAGSLATLLWRRVLHSGGVEARMGRFLRLGVLSVPPAIALATVALWGASRVLL